jgi:hypothetical protein
VQVAQGLLTMNIPCVTFYKSFRRKKNAGVYFRFSVRGVGWRSAGLLLGKEPGDDDSRRKAGENTRVPVPQRQEVRSASGKEAEKKHAVRLQIAASAARLEASSAGGVLRGRTMTMLEVILRRLRFGSATTRELVAFVADWGYSKTGAGAALKRLRGDGRIVQEEGVYRIAEKKP